MLVLRRRRHWISAGAVDDSYYQITTLRAGLVGYLLTNVQLPMDLFTPAQPSRCFSHFQRILPHTPSKSPECSDSDVLRVAKPAMMATSSQGLPAPLTSSAAAHSERTSSQLPPPKKRRHDVDGKVGRSPTLFFYYTLRDSIRENTSYLTRHKALVTD